MPELTPQMHKLLDHCAVQTLVIMRKHFPEDADALYVTLALRTFMDVLKDQEPQQAQRIADLFNGPANDTPWRLVKVTN